MKSSGAELVHRLVLDTSAYSQFRRGHELVLDFIAAAGMVFLPVTVLGELEAGFELGSRTKENRSYLGKFMAEPFVQVVAVTPSIASHYGRLFARLRRAGTPIPVNDIWIAAATFDCGGHLLTFDGDYRHVDALGCTIVPS